MPLLLFVLLLFLLRVRFGVIALVLVFHVAVRLHVGCADAVFGVEDGERERAHDTQARQCVVVVVVVSTAL
jgi:hypothetical protein